MTHTASIRDEVEAVGWQWRANATHVVLVVLAAFGLPLALCCLAGKFIVLPWPARGTSLLAYGALVFAFFLHRRHYRWRAVILLVSLYVLAIMQLAMNGLVGHGRIAALVLPLLGLILLGSKEGWIAAALTTLLLVVSTFLAGNGTLIRWQLIHENSLDPGYWFFQDLMLLGALVPLMLLFTRFLALQTQSMVIERQSRQELEDESAARRRLEAELVRVGDEERRRLGAELHDGLGQDLLVIINQAQFGLLKVEHPPAVSARLQNIVETAKQALEQTRRMAHNAYPGLLDELGFTKAVRAMLQKVTQASGVSMVIHLVDVDGLLPPESELHLFRIMQEAINNVLKHACASEVRVMLTREAASIRLVIEDNGRGFDPDQIKSAPPGRRGLGLHQIVVRAHTGGGRITLQSRPGQGTRLMVEMPVRGA